MMITTYKQYVLVIPEPNDELTINKHGHMTFDPEHEWDKVAVYYLNKIMDKTNAKIVLTSTMRKDKSIEFIKKLGKDNGLEIYDVIPHEKDDDSSGKSKDIIEWLNKHNDVNKFVILDDHKLDLEENFPKEFIQEESLKGFNRETYKKSLDILD